MRALRLAVCVLAATVALPQTTDIFERLRQALAATGQGERAAAALKGGDFGQVERMLAGSRPTSEAGRAELFAVEGAVEFLAGDMSKAAASYGEAAKLVPLGDGDRFTLAMALANLGDVAHARPVLVNLSQKYPQRALYVYWLGRLDYYEHRYVRAIENLRRAAELDPTSARIWDSLGLAFDMGGRMDEALNAFQKAAALNRTQTHPSAWPPHDLGSLLLRMNKEKDAEAALREALRYDPNLAQAHYHLGRALEKQGETKAAIDEYTAAVSDDTRSSDACYSLAMLLRKTHREAEASAMFAEFKKRKRTESAGAMGMAAK